MSSEAKSIAISNCRTPWYVLVKRLLLASAGVLFVLIGYIGIAVPGIPTIGPLLLASFLFTKSCPFLEQRLIRNRFFANILPYLDGKVEMPLQAKLASIGLMWTSIAISSWLFITAGIGAYWLPSAMIISGIVGMIFILRFGKSKRS